MIFCAILTFDLQRSWPYGQTRLLSCQPQSHTNGKLASRPLSLKSVSKPKLDKAEKGHLKAVRGAKLDKVPNKPTEEEVSSHHAEENEEVDRPNSTTNGDCGSSGQITSSTVDILPESPAAFVHQHYTWPNNYRQNVEHSEYYYNQNYPEDYIHY